MKEKIILITSCVLLALMPVGVQVDNDSTETNLEFMANTGQYAYVARGCDNEVRYKQPLPLKEMSAAVDYKTNSPIRIGVKGSYLRTEIEDENSYEYNNQTGRYEYRFHAAEGVAVNPFVNVETDNFAIGGGALWTDNSLPFSGSMSSGWSPSGYVRFGNLKTFYVDMSLFHTTPLISGNYLNLGIGSRRNPGFEWWLGTGFLPYENLGLVGKTYIPVNERTAVSLFARFGSTEGIIDGAIGIGLRYGY